jgi:hypothetical protein
MSGFSSEVAEGQGRRGAGKEKKIWADMLPVFCLGLRLFGHEPVE